MSFSDTFIRRPVLTTVCSLLIVLVGLSSLPALPIENLPNIAPPLIQVVANYGGANAEVTEAAVTNPIEYQIDGAPGVSYIGSNTTLTGNSTINVYFEQGTDIDIDQVNVQNRVSLAMPQLPQQVQLTGVSVKQSTPSILLAYQVGSTEGQFDAAFLNGLIYSELYYELSRVPGVASVNLLGGSNPAFWLFLDPAGLTANGITADEVVEAVGRQNTVAIGGMVGGPPAGGQQAFAYPLTVQNNGNLTSVEQLNDLILKSTSTGNLLRLRDVGKAMYGFNTFSQACVDKHNHPSVDVAVFQTPGSNALDVSRGVEKVMNEFTARVPPGVKVELIYNVGQFIQSAVEGVVDALGLAIVLVLLVLFLFLQDWRATVVPSLAIPISLVGTFAFVKVFGFSINQLTLLGVVLATGLVVDDAIVVIEAVSVNLEQGMTPRQAAMACMGELLGALISTALVLMAVFVPVAFYPGSIGIIYRQFALTIAFAVGISAFNALTFSPMLSSLILRRGAAVAPRGWPWILAGAVVGLAFGRFNGVGGWTYALGVALGVLGGANLPWIFARFNAVFERLRTAYARLVAGLVARRRAVMLFLAGGILLTGVAFSSLPQAFIPNEDQGYGLGIFQLQNGASLSQTSTVAGEIAAILDREPDIQAGAVVSGYGFNGGSPDQGVFFYGFRPLEERRSPEHRASAVVQRLNLRLRQLSSGLAMAAEPAAIPGFSSQGGFTFQFNDLSRGGYSFSDLHQLARRLIAAGNQSGDFSSLYTQFIPSAPAFRLSIDRDAMGALNIDFKQAMDTIAILAGSNFAGLTYESGQVRNIYVQAEANSRSSLEDILGYYVRDREGKLVPVSQFTEVELTSAPPVINHYNLYRTIVIQGAEAIGRSSGQALASIQKVFRAENFNNVGYAFTGLAALQLSAGAASLLVFGLGILVVFLVLSAQYESFITPLIILMTVPLAMLGALAFLAARAMDLNIYAQVGLVTLIGLAAKNAILIVEVAEQRLRQGASPEEAAITAAESRLRPILMTAIAALAGFSPLVFASGAGAHSQQALGTVIFGGLLVATVLSLGVVPPFYVFVKHRHHAGPTGG
ncbi:MAG: efflux RND transporter permease subunit [Synechococcaceae cyanobacterium]|nr:efflux RND transporter permease subunit [Synechococcaceae cyanobacterium]